MVNGVAFLFVRTWEFFVLLVRLGHLSVAATAIVARGRASIHAVAHTVGQLVDAGGRGFLAKLCGRESPLTAVHKKPSIVNKHRNTESSTTFRRFDGSDSANRSQRFAVSFFHLHFSIFTLLFIILCVLVNQWRKGKCGG